jgi:hypothetical protein
MAEEEPEKKKRPEFVNGVRVKAPEDYDFNTWGTSFIIQAKISPSTIKSSSCAQTLSGKKLNSRIGSDASTK